MLKYRSQHKYYFIKVINYVSHISVSFETLIDQNYPKYSVSIMSFTRIPELPRLDNLNFANLPTPYPSPGI